MAEGNFLDRDSLLGHRENAMKFLRLGFGLAAVTFASGCISYSSTTRSAPPPPPAVVTPAPPGSAVVTTTPTTTTTTTVR